MKQLPISLLFFASLFGPLPAEADARTASSRIDHNPGVDNWARDHWYVYFQHIRPGLLKGKLPPIDFHEIIALIAPRAFLDASPNFAFFVHGRGHSVAYESRELIYGWLDSHLKPAEATRTHRVGEEPGPPPR